MAILKLAIWLRLILKLMSNINAEKGSRFGQSPVTRNGREGSSSMSSLRVVIDLSLNPVDNPQVYDQLEPRNGNLCPAV